MKAKVILNPYSGRWSALQRKPQAEAALKAAGIEYDLVTTQTQGHGTELAAQAVREGFYPIIAAGGDGSIGEVVNGMMLAAGDEELKVPLGVLPLGSANDLADNIGLPRDLHAAAKIIAAGHTRKLDLCQVNTHYFDNNSAIGLEPSITLIQQQIPLLKGNLRYLLATLTGVMANRKWTMHLEWEGGEYSGPVTLVTIGNCVRTGGVFFVTPHADPFDGMLTFVYGYMPSRLQILRLLPRTMKPGAGNYVEDPAIHEIHSPWLRIHAHNPTPMHTDGEIQSKAIQDLEYRVLPGKLPILLPPASI
ncbi:MAG: diacylglycerol/lipid kinase family protein [Omnitrophica WOR_2 bacterium]